jgi:DnaJ-class molecular chaperone
MDYYNVLGLNKTASKEDIRKAYKKLSMKHHPDRGGDESTFKKVNEAYQTLSDDNKRQMYDMGQGDPFGGNQQQWSGHRSGPFEFRFDSGGFEDMFAQAFGAGFGPQGHRRRQRNKDVSISVTISMEDLLVGKTVHAEVGLPSGRKKLVTIEIPRGIEDGQQIRYEGMGDDSLKHIPAGNLIVYIKVQRHPRFERHRDDLHTEQQVSVWDCLIGSRITVKTIDGRNLNVNIPPGTQPETIMRVTGEGIPNVRTHQRGNLLLKIKTVIPKNLNPEQKEQIRILKDSL